MITEYIMKMMFDVLSISMPTVEDSEPTKRSIASAVARLYDVLGWMAPTTLFLKVLLQKLWELHLDWDETAPESIAARWERWKIEVPLLANHTLPRRYLQGEAGVQDMQLHGFSDASQQGYGGVIYLRVLYSDSTIGVSLVIAKTRVAPLKTLSIPKLELCGAQLTASFGRHGSKLGKLNYPTDVAFDDAGHVYADGGLGCMRVVERSNGSGRGTDFLNEQGICSWIGRERS